MARAKSLSVTVGSVIHIIAISFIQYGKQISSLSSIENWTEELAPEYSTSSVYMPGVHIAASNGKLDGSSVVSAEIGGLNNVLFLSSGFMMYIVAASPVISETLTVIDSLSQ